MTSIDALLLKCFQDILDRKFSSVKAMLDKPDAFGDDMIAYGRKTAIQGIMNKLVQKSSIEKLFEDRENINTLKRTLKTRHSSIWADDFDRGYFHTWIKFIRYAQRHFLKAERNSIVEDPSVEE